MSVYSIMINSVKNRYDTFCRKLYGWTSDKNFAKELAKQAITLPASAVCAVGSSSWMEGYVKQK